MQTTGIVTIKVLPADDQVNNTARKQGTVSFVHLPHMDHCHFLASKDIGNVRHSLGQTLCYVNVPPLWLEVRGGVQGIVTIDLEREDS